MAAVAVYAYGFAGTFRLRELVSAFAPVATARVEKDRLIADYPAGYALAYKFGAVVFVGVDTAERQRVVAAISERLAGEPHPPLTEDFLIETGSATFDVRFDRVLVPELNLPIVDTVALVLAQSVAIDYYAEDVAEIEAETERIAVQLRKDGRIRGRLRQRIRFIGHCIETRNAVISTLALFDKPDATWENEQLDRLWTGLYRMLELDDRSRALEAKLRMFQDNLVVLVDLTRQRYTLTLEAIVAVLILLEVAIMVWQVMTASGH